MSLFGKSSRNNNDKTTTRGFYLGSTEAEAENQGGTLNHNQYFEDYLSILPQISKGRFIITGRKGAGKSAIAKFIKDTATKTPNAFAEIVRLSDLQLEKLKQFDQNNEFDNKEAVIVEWIILVRLISMIVKNENAHFIDEFKPLKRFLETNAGMVNIDQYEIAALETNKKWEVSFEPLARVAKPVFGKYFNLKTVKAPFYKLINPLKEIVQTVINYDVCRKVDFVLLFDDLDINLKSSDEKSLLTITDLIRVAKHYNNDIFRNTDAKVIIFIRDDIKKLIDTYHSDTAKIFSSYEIKLNWYDHESFKINENLTHLKKFINRRIKLNFESKGIHYNSTDPWSSLVQNNNAYYADKTAFKYILDHSFYRPRDLILFFNPIGQQDFKFPLVPQDIRFLLKIYAEENMREIQNELSLSLRAHEIVQLMNVLRDLCIPQTLTIGNIDQAVTKYNINRPVEDVIRILCSYSLLGLKDKRAPKYYFSHREKFDLESMVLSDYDFVVHRVPYTYFNPSVQNLFG